MTEPAATPPPTPAPTPAPAALASAAPAVPPVPLTDAGLAAEAPDPAPTRVQLPALGIDVAVEPAATDAAGALALSEDPGIASWYRYGPSPFAAAGSAVVAAHVDSLEYGLGQFAALASAPVGTEVTVTGDDGSTARFTVVSVVTADKTGVPWAEVFDRSGDPRLTLITCGGEFDYDTGHYLSNVIVTAVPAT